MKFEVTAEELDAIQTALVKLRNDWKATPRLYQFETFNEKDVQRLIDGLRLAE